MKLRLEEYLMTSEDVTPDGHPSRNQGGRNKDFQTTAIC
jgi:hypothetical protein